MTAISIEIPANVPPRKVEEYVFLMGDAANADAAGMADYAAFVRKSAGALAKPAKGRA